MSVRGGSTLCFTASLSLGSVGFKGNQLSMQLCNSGEWQAYLSHRAEARAIPPVDRGRLG
jgi:hypothetical protein